MRASARTAAETTAEVASRTVKAGSIPGRAAANDQPNPSSVNPTTWNRTRGGCRNPGSAHEPAQHPGWEQDGRWWAGVVRLPSQSLGAADGQYPACAGWRHPAGAADDSHPGYARARWTAVAAPDGRPATDRTGDARENGGAHRHPGADAANSGCNHSTMANDASRTVPWKQADDGRSEETDAGDGPTRRLARREQRSKGRRDRSNNRSRRRNCRRATGRRPRPRKALRSPRHTP